MPPERPLAGRVALVAGATRGCGRAIAVELGVLGATVYGSGRSTRAGRSPMDRPETIEATAERVDAVGGTGVAVRCDHGEPDDVRALVDRIRAEQGRLDVLVNDAWGGDPFVAWGKPVWQHDLADTLRVVRNGIETHLITAHHAIPLLLETDGLVVEVGDGKAGVPFRGVVAYDHVKEAVVRLGVALHAELAPHGATALSVTPGFLRSEAMLDAFGVTEATWRDASDAGGGWFRFSETPSLLGRGVAALAADPDRARFGGRCLGSWDLMHAYGLTDADGARPDWGAVDAQARRATAEAGHPAAE